MKKIITLLVLVLGLNLSSSFAQEGAYLTIYGGYAMPAASTANWSASTVTGVDSLATQVPGGAQWIDVDNRTTDVNGIAILNINTTAVNLNLGKGVNVGASFGYMFNDRFGAELGISYFIGSKNSYKQSEINEFDPANITEFTFEGEMSASQIRINPMFVVSTDFKDFMPYAKLGIVIGVGTKIKEKYDDSMSIDTLISQEFTSKGGIALGVNGVFGAQYNFSKKTGLFLEMQVTAMSYSPKEREMTAYTINGKDQLTAAKFPTSARLTEYVKEVNYTNAEPIDPTLSTLATQLKYPFTSFAINLGIRISF